MQDDVNIDAERGWPQMLKDESGELYNAAAKSIHSLGVPGETSVPPRVPPVRRGVERGTEAPENDVAQFWLEADF
jgi:hypothetical protein